MAPSPIEGAIPPPVGFTPTGGHPGSPLRTTYSAALCVMLVFPATLVPIRLYAKTFLLHSWRKTDVTCLVGFLWYIALMAVAFVVLNVGMGSHAWNLTPSTFSRLEQLLNIHQIIYMPSITFTKVAILLQLKDIFSPPHLSRNPRWYLLYTMIILNCVFFTTLLFLEIFQCIPRHKIWNHSVEGRCIDIKKTFVATGVINVVDDFLILIIPLVWTWKMQLKTRQKLGVSLIFATGLFACVTSVVRLAKSIECLGNPDISYTFAPVLLWAVAEVTAGLVVCCLPVMPRVFRHKSTNHALPEPKSSNQSSSLYSKWKIKAPVTTDTVESTFDTFNDGVLTIEETATGTDDITPLESKGLPCLQQC